MKNNGVLNDLSTQNNMSWWTEKTYLDFGTYNLGQMICGRSWMERFQLTNSAFGI